MPPAPFEDETAGRGEQRDGTVRRAWGIGIGVAGLATLAVGGILGGVAATKWSDAQDACPNGTRCPNDEAYEQSQEARLLGDLATIAFVTGGSALIGAAVVWFTAPDGPDEPAAGPDGAEALGSVRLAPWVGPAAGGLAASGSF